jgi:predicted nucleic acid-binding Zn ribbon protein
VSRDDANRSHANKPRAIADALAELLDQRGLDDDLARAGVLEAWSKIVGTQIAAVTQPRLITDDGTLVVGVKTHGWMQELTMMERQLIAKLAAGAPKAAVKKLRWELLREPTR